LEEIKLIQLGEEQFQQEFYDSDRNAPLEYFGPIGKINIMVGANNSRKSRFIRGVLKRPNYVITSMEVFSLLRKMEKLNLKIEEHIRKKPIVFKNKKSNPQPGLGNQTEEQETIYVFGIRE